MMVKHNLVSMLASSLDKRLRYELFKIYVCNCNMDTM